MSLWHCGQIRTQTPDSSSSLNSERAPEAKIDIDRSLMSGSHRATTCQHQQNKDLMHRLKTPMFQICTRMPIMMTVIRLK